MEVGNNPYGLCFRLAPDFDKERCNMGDCGSPHEDFALFSCSHNLYVAKTCGVCDFIAYQFPLCPIEILNSLQDSVKVYKKLWVQNLTAYHPKTYGQSERVIQILEGMLRGHVAKLSTKVQGSWECYLPLAEFAYSNSYQASIQMAPFEALYGTNVKLPCVE
ncbi:gag-pol [Gossypium australe]|uniref:Gag-pol n=1 Tax=Gossypium australe TaxID=47621 RepID=A0A5B6VJW2_9ROSI|nr:gag-pol [Gossypium australe]